MELKIVSPLRKTLVSTFTLRLSFNIKPQQNDVLAVYIKDDLFTEQELTKELKISNLPLDNDEIFDIGVVIMRAGSILATTKEGPYQYRSNKKPMIKEEYYVTRDSTKMPESVVNVLILPSEDVNDGEIIFLTLPVSPVNDKINVVNASKRVVNLLDSGKVVKTLSRYTNCILSYSNGW